MTDKQKLKKYIEPIVREVLEEQIKEYVKDAIVETLLETNLISKIIQETVSSSKHILMEGAQPVIYESAPTRTRGEGLIPEKKEIKPATSKYIEFVQSGGISEMIKGATANAPQQYKTTANKLENILNAPGLFDGLRPPPEDGVILDRPIPVTANTNNMGYAAGMSPRELEELKNSRGDW